MRGLLLCLVLLFTTACATSQSFAPPDTAMRGQFGAMLLSTEPPPQHPPLEELTKGKAEAALRGARIGARGTVDAGFELCAGGGGGSGLCGWGMILGITLAPIAALVGSVTGASLAHSQEEVDTATAAIDAALNEFSHEAPLKQAFLNHIAENGVEVEVIPEGRIVGRGNTDTTLQLTLHEFQWQQDGRIDPEMQLQAKIKATVRDNRQQLDLYAREWQYLGPEEEYFQLAADDAALLRQRMQEAIDMISQKIVWDLFVAEHEGQAHSGPAADYVTTTSVSAFSEIAME